MSMWKNKKRKNKKSPSKLKSELFDKYANAFQKEMDVTFKKADRYWDEIVVDWLSAYDLVLESVVKNYLEWMDFFIEKKLNFITVVETYQQYVYDEHWLMASWMFADVRAKWYNIIKPWSNRKWTEYFQFTNDWLSRKWIRNGERMLARINKNK